MFRTNWSDGGRRADARLQVGEAEVDGPSRLLRHMPERHAGALRRWAQARGSSEADIADLVQETFEKALKACPPVRNDDELRAWLFVVLRNQFVNKHRALAAFMSVPCELLALPAQEPEAMPLWRQNRHRGGPRRSFAAVADAADHLRASRGGPQPAPDRPPAGHPGGDRGGAAASRAPAAAVSGAGDHQPGAVTGVSAPPADPSAQLGMRTANRMGRIRFSQRA